MHDEQIIKQQFLVLKPLLDERTRRLWAACEAKALGWAGIVGVSQATGLSRTTMAAGLRESAQPAETADGVPVGRIRRAGGGWKRLTQQVPQLRCAVESRVDPVPRGDPQSPLRWSCQRTYKLATALQAMGPAVAARTVAHLLKEMHYRLQANRTTREGAAHPERDAQFHHINDQTRAFHARHQPVSSVDTKKKARVGDFKNAGREWQPKGAPKRFGCPIFSSSSSAKRSRTGSST